MRLKSIADVTYRKDSRSLLSVRIPFSRSSKPGMTSDLRTRFCLLCWGYCSPEGCSALLLFSCHVITHFHLRKCNHTVHRRSSSAAAVVWPSCVLLDLFFCSCIRIILILIRGRIKFSVERCICPSSLLARSTYLSVNQCLPPNSMKYSKTCTRLPHSHHSPKPI